MKIQTNPKNPRERAAYLDALGDSLAKINRDQLEAIEAPCCAPCAGISLGADDALKDASSLISDGRGGPISIVAYSMAMAMKKGKHCHMRHETHDDGETRPVYYADRERRDPLRVYQGHACPCGKLKGKDKP